MANEIVQFYPQGSAAGYTLYSLARNLTGQVWHPTGQAFETWGGGVSRTADDYDGAMTNKRGGLYLGNFDSNIPDGIYYVAVCRRVGTAPDDTIDAVVGGGRRRWVGGKLYEDDTLWLNNSVDLTTATHTYTVTDGSGNRIADVLVEAKISGGSVVVQSARTDANGNAVFYLPAGIYDFIATKAGFSFPANPDRETVSA